MDVQTDLDHLRNHLPADSYIVYIEDLTAGQAVHWSRWPRSHRPGFAG